MHLLECNDQNGENGGNTTHLEPCSSIKADQDMSAAEPATPSSSSKRLNPWPDAFHKLIQNISTTLGATSGLDTPDIDPQVLINLMDGYRSTESTRHFWHPYAYNDPSRAYTRNLVSSTNPNANILLIVWNPGKSSPIHDHANAHCVMKVLQGSLQETLYTTTCPDDPPSTLRPSSTTTSPSPCGLSVTKRTRYMENQVAYISDQIGLHQISNPSDTEVAVSLHLYTPPHAANFGFNMFDEKTGRKTHVRQCNYFSAEGRKCT